VFPKKRKIKTFQPYSYGPIFWVWCPSTAW